MVLRADLRLATIEAITSAITNCSGTTMAASRTVFRTDGQKRKFFTMVWTLSVVKPAGPTKACTATCTNGYTKNTSRNSVAGSSSR